jgi:hypothetical protein
LEELIFLDSGDPNPLVIISGDMNDGPGMDFFEEYYLLFDSVNALLGNYFRNATMLFPLLTQPQFISPADQYTCIFKDYVDNIPAKHVLLDNIFVSTACLPCCFQATVAHEIWEKYSSTSTYCDRQNYVSDHRPVFADFSFVV